jgi:enoyl-CoA hydratase/carnithine racemase
VEPLHVRYSLEEEVAFITLNRPAALNALNPQMFAELDAALEQALADSTVHAILLAGEGKSFCAGWDVKTLSATAALPFWDRRMGAQTRRAIARKLWLSAKPVLCAVQGYCFADGYELANQADLLIAADDALFAEPQIRYGWVPDPMTLWLVGMRRAKEKLLLGDRFNAVEAHRIGLANWVVPREQLAAESRRLAIKLARMPTETMQLTKRTLNQAAEMQGYAEISDWHLDVEMVGSLSESHQKKEYEAIGREQGLEAALDWIDERYNI